MRQFGGARSPSLAGVADLLVVADHLVDDEAEKFFRKFRIEVSIAGELPQPFDLLFLARGVRRGQVIFGFIFADRLGDLEPFGEDEHQRGIDIVDTLPILFELFVHKGVPALLIQDPAHKRLG